MRKNLKAEIIKSDFANQTDFVRSLGKRDDWLSRIITGRQDPTDEEKQLIAKKLGVDVNKQGLWLNS